MAMVVTRLQSLDDTAIVLAELYHCVGTCFSHRDPNTRMLLDNLSLREERRQLSFQISRNRNAPRLCCNITVRDTHMSNYVQSVDQVINRSVCIDTTIVY